MDNAIDFQTIVSQLPNFLGLLIALYVQWKVISQQASENKQLLDVIISRQNCDETEKPAKPF